ncbi:putative oxidoreductase [Escherichia coli]|uniref:Putative oxidoreductase n=1 Tax=Escherichia coli TaxID=562 RepID=A0A377C005_ECOLX|nr:putative oxidoreductase [Escherichia coli]
MPESVLRAGVAARCRISPQPQHINTMLYEAELFATLVDEHLVDHPGLAVSRITAKLLTEIRPPDWGDFSGR